MNQPTIPPRPTNDPASLERLTHIVYALQAAGFLLGLSFIAALIVNCIKIDDVRGSWLESHFRWQMRTFWFGLLWAALGSLTYLLAVGYLILVADGIWLIYRIAKGWVFLGERRPMYA